MSVISTPDSHSNNQRTYVVVLRAPSAARFDEAASLTINKVPVVTGHVDVIFRTRYRDEGFNAAVPRELWADVRGTTTSLDEAVVPFANAALFLTPVLSLSANAATGDLEVELAFENTPGIDEREYFQQFVLEEGGLPRIGRRINTDAAAALINAIFSHPDGERLHRAISQYDLALRHWKLGQETLALAYLYMGMDALPRALVKHLCRTQGQTEEQLAASLGIKPQIPEEDIVSELEKNKTNFSPKVYESIKARVRHGSFKIRSSLESNLRLSHLFQGDNDCYKKAKAASDGFEHGFMPLRQVHSNAKETRDRTAKYLRTAIINLTEIDDQYRALLLSSPYESHLDIIIT